MKNILIFLLDQEFAASIHVWANNEHDLRQFLIKEYNYRDINFNDLDSPYGTCSFRDDYGIKVTKCFYIPSV